VPNGFSRILSRQALSPLAAILKQSQTLPMVSVGPVDEKARAFRSGLDTTMNTKSVLSAFAVLLMALRADAQYAPATDDVWDVSQGTILILSTDLNGAPSSPFDMRDMFGGTFGTSSEPGNLLFTDGTAEDSVHIIEWRVKKELVVKSFRLFASDDEATGDHGFKTFRLKAKSLGQPTFDTLLFEWTPQQHPFEYEDLVHHLLLGANVQPVLAQEFLAEFTTWNGSGGAAANGPRIIELDGFTDAIAMRPEIRITESEISWISAPGVEYQVQYREKIDGSTWHNINLPVLGTGAKMSITDSVPAGRGECYYRVLTLRETLN
jgi:hypothetical protein